MQGSGARKGFLFCTCCGRVHQQLLFFVHILLSGKCGRKINLAAEVGLLLSRRRRQRQRQRVLNLNPISDPAAVPSPFVSQTLLDTRANSTPRKLLARVEFIAADSDRALSQVQVHSKEFITERVRR
jgi:hypothetical protein